MCKPGIISYNKPNKEVEKEVSPSFDAPGWISAVVINVQSNSAFKCLKVNEKSQESRSSSRRYLCLHLN